MNIINSYIIDPLLTLMDTFKGVYDYSKPVIGALIILVFGLLIAKGLHKLLHHVFGEIKLDKYADKFGINAALHKGGVKSKLSGVFNSLVSLVVVVTFIIMAVKMLKIGVISGFIDAALMHVPKVFGAVIMLSLGLIIADIAGKVMHVMAHLTSLPKPDLMGKITRWVVILYAATVCLRELGYGMLLVGNSFHIILAGIVFAYALAFGLGGRDRAAKYLEGKKK